MNNRVVTLQLLGVDERIHINIDNIVYVRPHKEADRIHSLICVNSGEKVTVTTTPAQTLQLIKDSRPL